MLTLIDLGAEFWRNALGGNDPINGYELTVGMLLLHRDDPRAIVCADSPRSERKTINPLYKSNRKPKPPQAIEALEGVLDRVAAWGMPLATVDGWEADDVIATLVAKSWPEQVRVIGSEKDFYCMLADERVTLIGKAGPLSANDCVDKFGVAPSQMSDWLAMVGDVADCIPGCDNTGPGRVTKLLDRFGSIEGIQAASDEEILSIKGIGQKTLDSLRAWDPKPAREMIRMREDLPIELGDLLQ